MSPSSSRSLSCGVLSASSRASASSVTSTSWLKTGPPTVLGTCLNVRAAGYRLPDRLLLACRTGCCRTTLVVGTSGSGTGSGLGRPKPSSPRLAPPFCPFAGPGVLAAASRAADPVWTRPAVLPAAAPDPVLGRGAPDAGRPLDVPARALPVAVFGALGSKPLLVSPGAVFAAPVAVFGPWGRS